MQTKFSSFLVLIAFLFLFGLTTYGQETNPTPRFGGSIRGETYAYNWTEVDFATTPSWSGEDGEPPLVLAAAVKIARTSLPRLVENAGAFRMRSVDLRRVGDDRWYYSVSFTCYGASCRSVGTRSFQIIVKMDGTILEPKKVVVLE